MRTVRYTLIASGRRMRRLKKNLRASMAPEEKTMKTSRRTGRSPGCRDVGVKKPEARMKADSQSVREDFPASAACQQAGAHGTAAGACAFIARLPVHRSPGRSPRPRLQWRAIPFSEPGTRGAPAHKSAKRREARRIRLPPGN